jgi:anthranilate synthase component 1
MDFNMNIQKIGRTNDIFGFFRYISSKEESKNRVLLESIDQSSKELHFSFIGMNPDFMVKVIGENLSFYNIDTELGEKIKLSGESGNFKDRNEYELPFSDEVPIPLVGLDKLKQIFPLSKTAIPELFPRKVFSGGLLGYVGFDVVAPFVGYQPSTEMKDRFPDILMGLYTNVLAYSHSTKTLYHINNSISNYKAELKIQKMLEKFKDRYKKKTNLGVIDKTSIMEQTADFSSNTSKEQWRTMIEAAREHIFAGDIIQTVLSRKMIAESDVDPLSVYEALRILNPSPFMYYLDYEGAHNGDVRIIGSSPEPLITKSQSHLETVPIAGTRRRGRNPEDEKKMENELLTSEKEFSEHIMLVDLARNDLARISEPGTVETFELIKLKKFPNVMHLVSKVKSYSNLDPFTILKSMFPAGTVSGAPKRRAMEIIHKLEQEDRGPYAGVVGYISFTGDMDMAISIRTLFNKNKTFIAQAGGGIVADSKPDEEYLETANKMRGILSTIHLARKIEEKNGGN